MLQDPDIQTKVLWEGMAIIRPWDAIPAEVLAMEPHIYEDVAIRSGELDEEQKEVLQVGCPAPLHDPRAVVTLLCTSSAALDLASHKVCMVKSWVRCIGQWHCPCDSKQCHASP